MSKFLRADAHAGAAYVEKNVTLDELYVTLDVSFDPSVFSSELVALADSGETLVWAIYWDLFATAWEEEFDTFDLATVPAAQPLGTFQTLEVHYKKNVLTEAWVDGTLLWTASETANQQIRHVKVGAVLFGGIAQFIDSVKIGTTRGGADVFADNFESGSLSAWDATTGDVSIVEAIVPDVPASVGVSVAFASPTLAELPIWTELAEEPYRLASGWRIDRGRSSEFDKTVTGTASIDLIDKLGVLDPTNDSSPFAGSIDPMKNVRIRLRNPVTGVTRYLFRGFASDWTYEIDLSGAFTKVTLECADAFDLLNALEMTPGHHGDTVPNGSEGDIYFVEGPVGELDIFGIGRINKALDDAGWPDGPREIFPGNILLQGTVYARLDALLSVLFDAADAEFPGVANVYVSKSGYVTFHGRYARFDPTNDQYGIQTWKAGGEDVALLDDTVALISSLSYRRSKDTIINAATYLPQGVDATDLPVAIVKDDASIDTYGWRSDSQENLLIESGRATATTTTFDVTAVQVAKKQAEWKVNNYKDPRTRVNQIEFRSRDPQHFTGPATWALICEVEIGDIISLQTNHRGGGGFDEDFFVEGIHYEALPMTEGIEGGFPDITLTLDLSPRSLYDFDPFS